MKPLLLSPIGLGLAALGRPGYINIGHREDLADGYSITAMEAHSHRVLDRAWKLGVRYFDVARSYGAAEAFLGSWLRGRNLKPDRITVGSKWGYTYAAGWQVEAEAHEIKVHTLTTLLRHREETRATLGSYLDIYQIHSATAESGVLEDREVLEELVKLKGEGVRVGLTLSGPAQGATLLRAMEISVDGERLFDSVQATWNLLERSAANALFEAKKDGMTVIIKEAVANGRLTNRNLHSKFAVKRKMLTAQAARLGTTVDALAIAAVLHRPWADVVLSGAATVEQVESNLKALDIEWDDEAEQTLKPLMESGGEYWRIRSELAWN
ncbi:MAG: aldo/keto reductase [Candidatus Krumholzibacteria bacterium]|nr:aldo/keto reductase [Candidatus Krumholzibacteria bacterium]